MCHVAYTSNDFFLGEEINAKSKLISRIVLNCRPFRQTKVNSSGKHILFCSQTFMSYFETFQVSLWLIFEKCNGISVGHSILPKKVVLDGKIYQKYRYISSIKPYVMFPFCREMNYLRSPP